MHNYISLKEILSVRIYEKNIFRNQAHRLHNVPVHTLIDSILFQTLRNVTTFRNELRVERQCIM